MSVDPADSAAHEPVPLDERQHFVVGAGGRLGQSFEERQDLQTAAQRAACQLADNERVTLHFGSAKQIAERRVAPAEMVHPNRGIN